MGIIIVPFLLGAFAMFIFSVATIYQQISENTFNGMYFIYGVILTMLLYSTIVLSYKLAKKPWALSPVFRFPFCMIYLPFISFFLIKINFGVDLNGLSNTLLMSIFSAGIFITIFNKYVFGILDKLGHKKHY